MTLKAKKIDDYISKRGNDTFVYEVSGTAEELEKFRAAKGEHYRETAAGVPLWYSPDYVGETCNLKITTNDNVVADKSRIRAALNLVKQAGGNPGEAFAQQAAKEVFGSLLGGSAPVAQTTPQTTAQTNPAPQEEPEQKPEEVEQLEDLDVDNENEN